MSLASVGYREIQGIVETWTKKYQYHISLIQSKPSEVRQLKSICRFMVQFSLPQPQKPVPVATIRVYFTCTNQDQLRVTFRFQKDSLIHSPNKTIRQQQIERWIDDSLAKKLLVRETVFYLGTAYESTRVKDTRQDNILKEVPKIEEKQFVYIHPDLLRDQQKTIDIMEKSHIEAKTIQSQLKKFYREIDKQNIEVITQPQFLTLIKNIGVKLNLIEEKELLKKVDPTQSGMIEYAQYADVIGQFIECLEAKKEADAKLATSVDQQLFGSILMLINDETQDIQQTLIQKFKAKDEDETGLTNISEIKTVLDQINKKAKEQNKPEPLNVIELADITKVLTDRFGYKEIPYASIHKHIIEYKITELAKGRINSHMNNLEVHLKELFEKYDDKKIGKIRIDNFEQALKKSQKIRLTKAQIYLLKSLIVIDGKNEINYIQNSKIFAELIKRFYLNSSKKKK